MRLPPGSRALRRRSSLPHSVPRRAPRDGTVGLRNPVSRDPVRERGDKVFGERLHATTGFFPNTDSDDYFPDDDFFPDVDALFDNMSATANGSSSTGPYVFLFCLVEIIFQTFSLAGSVELLYPYSMLDCMTSLFYTSLAMFYLMLLWIKSYRKLLIYSTNQDQMVGDLAPLSELCTIFSSFIFVNVTYSIYVLV